MFRVCSQVLLSSSVTSALCPPNWCNSHGCLGSTSVTFHPKRDDPCFTKRGEKKSLSGFNDPVPVWPCTFWWLAEVICVDLPYFCVIKNGKSLWREPKALHSLSSIRLLSCASCFDSSHDSVTCFHKLEQRQMQGRGQNGTGRRCYFLPWKAILNNSSGIRKVTL